MTSGKYPPPPGNPSAEPKKSLPMDTGSVRRYARDREIFEKLSGGYTHDRIAREYKLNIRQVHDIEDRCMRRNSSLLYGTEEMRVKSDTLLTELLFRLRELWDAPSYKTTPTGVIVRDPNTGLPVEDHTMKIALASEVRKLDESRRKLHGVDKPVKKVMEIESAFEGMVAELIGQMGDLGLDGELDGTPRESAG